MLAAFAVSTVFLASYVDYHARVGSVPFWGGGWLRAVYLTVLVPHVILATVMVPLILLTLGLFTFIVNGGMLYLTASVVRGFAIDGFGSAILGALVLSIVSFLLNMFVADSGRIEYVYVQRS